MNQAEIIEMINIELKKAKEKHPYSPGDIVHQIAILAEESGEAVQAVLNKVYDSGGDEEIKT